MRKIRVIERVVDALRAYAGERALSAIETPIDHAHSFRDLLPVRHEAEIECFRILKKIQSGEDRDFGKLSRLFQYFPEVIDADLKTVWGQEFARIGEGLRVEDIQIVDGESPSFVPGSPTALAMNDFLKRLYLQAMSDCLQENGQLKDELARVLRLDEVRAALLPDERLAFDRTITNQVLAAWMGDLVGSHFLSFLNEYDPNTVYLTGTFKMFQDQVAFREELLQGWMANQANLARLDDVMKAFKFAAAPSSVEAEWLDVSEKAAGAGSSKAADAGWIDIDPEEAGPHVFLSQARMALLNHGVLPEREVIVLLKNSYDALKQMAPPTSFFSRTPASPLHDAVNLLEDILRRDFHVSKDVLRKVGALPPSSTAPRASR